MHTQGHACICMQISADVYWLGFRTEVNLIGYRQSTNTFILINLTTSKEIKQALIQTDLIWCDLRAYPVKINKSAGERTFIRTSKKKVGNQIKQHLPYPSCVYYRSCPFLSVSDSVV